jgi:hypothetical protein
MTPSISIVTVTHDSRNDIGRVLDSLVSSGAAGQHEIIVVDNASRDDTLRIVGERLPVARVIERRVNGGLSAGINEGVRASHGEFVLILNPDVRFDRDPAPALAAYLRAHPSVGVVAPRLLNEDGSVQLSCRAFPSHATAVFNRYSLLTRLAPGNPFSRRYLMSDFDHATTRDVDWVSGAALMFRRDVFNRLGGWDDEFFLFSEDVDFCRRVHDLGLRVVYLPQETVEHRIGISRSRSPRIIVERHRSVWRYYRKHMRRNIALDAAAYAAIAVRCLIFVGSAGIQTARRRLRA